MRVCCLQAWGNGIRPRGSLCCHRDSNTDGGALGFTILCDNFSPPSAPTCSLPTTSLCLWSCAALLCATKATANTYQYLPHPASVCWLTCARGFSRSTCGPAEEYKFIAISNQRSSQEWASLLWTIWVIQITQSPKPPHQIVHHCCLGFFKNKLQKHPSG